MTNLISAFTLNRHLTALLWRWWRKLERCRVCDLVRGGNIHRPPLPNTIPSLLSPLQHRPADSHIFTHSFEKFPRCHLHIIRHYCFILGERKGVGVRETAEGGGGGAETHGPPQLHSDWKASLGFIGSVSSPPFFLNKLLHHTSFFKLFGHHKWSLLTLVVWLCVSTVLPNDPFLLFRFFSSNWFIP